MAERAGVSMRTVSNVVNGFRHVAPATRARVLQAIDELDYHPSELGRQLRVGRSGLIALVLPDLDNPYFAELVRAFVEEGTQRELTVVIDQTDGDLARERFLIDRTHKGALFDALIISPLALTPEHLQGVEHGRPLVFLGENPFPAFDRVSIDNHAATLEAMAHLAAAGRRRIAAIGAEQRSQGTSSIRLQGYFDGLDAAGLPRDEALVGYVEGFLRPWGSAAMERLLDTADPPPDAVFCFSDRLAQGALRTLHRRGVKVPDDIALIGFDDVQESAYLTPALTTVAPDKRFIASASLDRVQARLDAAEPLAAELIIAPHHLAVRESA